MNEYKKLIDYLKNRINNIEEKLEKIENEKKESSTFKETLEIIIKQITELELTEIDTIKMKDVLISIIGEDASNEVINQFNVIVTFTPYLIDERINSPIKQEMLKDLEAIKNIIIKVKKVIEEKKFNTISEKELEEKQELEKYLEIVSENGFNKLLSTEDRTKFYNFLKTSGIELSDVLVIIKDYIKLGVKLKRNEEILISNSSIDVVNANAEAIIKELEQENQIKKVPPQEEVSLEILELPDLTEEQQKIYEEILRIIDQNKNNINPSTYELYKNMYINLDITEIYIQRSSFLDINGIEWEKAIPCIKEKLIPMINTQDRTLIFQIFNCIISLNKNQIEQKNQINKESKEYKVVLKQFEEKFKQTLEEIKKLESESNFIINEIEEKLNSNNKENILSLLDRIKNESKEEIEPEFFESFNISSYELARNYVLLDYIFAIKEYIEEYMEIGISNDDYNNVIEEYENLKKFIKEYKSNYKIILEQIKEQELTKNMQITDLTPQPKINSIKQYESGKNIIIFYRKNEESKFLVEEDLEHSTDINKNYIYVEKILKTVNDIEYWHWREKRYYNFREDINKTATIKKPYEFKSNFSGKNLEFSRLKAPMQKKGEDNNTRLSCLKIDLCEENRIKLNLPSRTIILIIGQMNISNHNSDTEYGYFRTQIEENRENIQKIVEQFENPNTPAEVMYKLLNDSSDLYNDLRGKIKGNGI